MASNPLSEVSVYLDTNEISSWLERAVNGDGEAVVTGVVVAPFVTVCSYIITS